MVLPAFHSAEVLARNVPVLLSYLGKLGVSHEVIIVDDGSQDEGRTRQVAQDLGCLYVGSPVNLGKGAAVRLGMRHASGKFRLFTDADIPYETEAIEHFLLYLDRKEFHFVVGDRRLNASAYFDLVPPARKMGSLVYSRLVRLLTASGGYDTQCGIKGFRAEVAEDLFGVGRIDGFAFDVELFHIAFLRNYDIKRVPVRLRCQEGSSVSLLRHSVAMVRDLAAIQFHDVLGHYR